MFEPLASTAADTPRFVKLDAQGNTVPANATDHIIVRDVPNRLEWAVAYASDDELDHAAAIETCTKLDIGGHTDWRLPTRFELESIIDLERCRPAIDPSLFPGTKSDWHWSSSPVASNPDCAWIVYFYYGSVYLSNRDDSAFVRAVRSLPASQ